MNKLIYALAHLDNKAVIIYIYINIYIYIYIFVCFLRVLKIALHNKGKM